MSDLEWVEVAARRAANKLALSGYYGEDAVRSLDILADTIAEIIKEKREVLI